MTDELEKEDLDLRCLEMKNFAREVFYFHPEMMNEAFFALQEILHDPTARLQAGIHSWDRNWLLEHLVPRLEPPAIDSNKSYHARDWDALFLYYLYMRKADFKFTKLTIAKMAKRDIETVEDQFELVEKRIREMIAKGELTGESTTQRIEKDCKSYIESRTGKLPEDVWNIYKEMMTLAGPGAVRELVRD